MWTVNDKVGNFLKDPSEDVTLSDIEEAAPKKSMINVFTDYEIEIVVLAFTRKFQLIIKILLYFILTSCHIFVVMTMVEINHYSFKAFSRF